MSPESELTAIKLPFEPGEYLTTWLIPGRKGEFVETPGMLVLEEGKYPRGILEGKVPLPWSTSEEGAVDSFPQRREFEVLTGQLSSGAYIALMNGWLTSGLFSGGRAAAAFAALSQERFDPAEHRRYQSVELQIEGLESVGGIAPIAEISFPKDHGDEQVWSTTINSDARFAWEADGHEMKLGYASTVRGFDFYEFKMAFGPLLQITSEVPLTAAEWWLNWILPLRQLISLLTGAPREIRYFVAAQGDKILRSHADQIFGWDVTHVTVNSTRVAVEGTPSAVNLAVDGVDLLSLLLEWQKCIEQRHPLIDTYGSMTTTSDQHPRSRFLLLLQAIEGSFGFENRDKHERERVRYVKKRQLIMARAARLLGKEDFRFIDNRLFREPHQGLANALAELLKRTPHETVDELEQSSLVRTVRRDSPRKGNPPLHVILTDARNGLSHGTRSFPKVDLEAAAKILERIVRAEAIRLLGAPDEAQARAAKKPER